MLKHVKKMQGKMPIYNTHIAEFLAEKQTDAILACLSSSIFAKIAAQDDMTATESMTKYAKAQKKDGFYDIHYVVELARTNSLGEHIS